jgi:hypothetical protein
VYVHWELDEPAATVEWDVTVATDPGSAVGEYLALFNGTIDGSLCYLGLQTDVAHPPSGRGIGKGLIFSTWWTFDAEDARVPDDGFIELGTHEGRFVGVRRPFAWTSGSYRVTLARAAADARGITTHDWFDLTIVELEARPSPDGAPAPRGAPTWIGSLAFPRRDTHRPARVDPGHLSFFEVYSRADTWADVARWDVALAAHADGRRCESGRTEYPAYPFGQLMPNANVTVEDTTGVVRVSFGGDVRQIDPARHWQSRPGG